MRGENSRNQKNNGLEGVQKINSAYFIGAKCSVQAQFT